MGDHNAVTTGGIQDTANCNKCHAATAGQADGSAPINAGNNKIHDGCMVSCHTIAASPGAIGGLQPVTASGGSGDISAGDCNNCHGTYFPSHGNINHTTAVAVDGICSDCHTGTKGTTTTVPTASGDNKVHDACSTCHEANGVLSTFAQADAHNPDWIINTGMDDGGTAGGTDGVNSCLTCHDDRFTTKAHSSTHDTKFYYDTTGTGADVDILQNNGSAGCASCHDDAGSSLASFAAIYQEHLSTCDKCHKETRDINETTASGTSVRQWIAAREPAADGTDTNCRTCHVPNWTNIPNHAGHNNTDFPWNGTTQTTCGAVGCHDYVANPDVVVNVHGGHRQPVVL
jgi:hypothetical protein